MAITLIKANQIPFANILQLLNSLIARRQGQSRLVSTVAATVSSTAYRAYGRQVCHASESQQNQYVHPVIKAARSPK